MEGSLVGIRPFLLSEKMDDLLTYLNSRDVVFLATRYHWKETLDVARKVKPFKMLAFGMGLDQLRDGFQKEGEYEALINLMQEVNLVTTFYERMISYFEAMTSTPVVYLPMCYPYSYAKNYRAEQTDVRVLVPGNVWNGELGGRRDDIGSCLIAHRLARLHDEIKITLMDRKIHTQIKEPATLITNLADRIHGKDISSRITLCGSYKWKEFLGFASVHSLSIHWDWCFTTGRMAADMAALGIPHIGGNSDHAEHFFPSLSGKAVHEWNLDRAIALCEDALYDKQFREWVIKEADAWGERIDYPGWRKWFTNLYEEHK